MERAPDRRAEHATLPWFARFSQVVLILIILVGLAPAAAVSEDLNPLHPADTSSPRDTLESFLRLSDEIALIWESEGFSDRHHLLFRGLRETMDFSATPYGMSLREQARRILLLREVLDRIELPPLAEIPGDVEVAEQDIAVWTIPGTRMQIVRHEGGVFDGDYLFSALTVGRLDRDYRRVEHLPYKPGQFGGHMDWFAPGGPFGVDSSILATRLKGGDFSSPLATLESFLASMNDAYRIAQDAQAALDATPPQITLAEAREADERARLLIEQAVSAFDLSEIPMAQREDLGIERALMLKEVLDRLALPLIDAVPGETEIVEPEDQDDPYRWRLPGTEIEIERIEDGDRVGEFLFDQTTVAALPGMYALLEDLPYRHVEDLHELLEYQSPDISPGFYEFYISYPGYLVPGAHFLGPLVNDLPDWTKSVYADQTLWQWIGLALTIALTGLLIWLTFRTVSALAAMTRPTLGHWILILAPALAVVEINWMLSILDYEINITGELLVHLVTLVGLADIAFDAFIVWRVASAIARTIIASPRIAEGGINASLVSIVASIVGICAIGALVIYELMLLGFDILPLLAGLGVGGLAVALAIRPTLENLIGGFILFTDKPVRVGDYCSFSGMSGTIESIGVRSTQVRALDRTLISIPNAKFVDMEIVNWARCDRMLVTTRIQLRYETGDDQLRYLLARLREMLLAHPKVQTDTVRVRFAGYGESSLDVDIRIYVDTRDWNDFYAVREDVFLRIKTIVREAGTGFAFPSRTVYQGQDSGIDEERGKDVEGEVAQWRKDGSLPFPNMAEQHLAELAGTLDYPPRGSVSRSGHDAAADVQDEPLSTRDEEDETRR